jgi:hypothetical protein
MSMQGQPGLVHLIEHCLEQDAAWCVELAVAAALAEIERPFNPTEPPSPLRKPRSSFRDRLKEGSEGPEMVWLPSWRFLFW